jgi:hypothetical protein
MNEKISINTVQELIEHRYTITIYCHNPRCHRRAMLDLVKIRQRLGPDHSLLFDDIKYKLRCSQCGGKQFGMTMSPPAMNVGKSGAAKRSDD